MLLLLSRATVSLGPKASRAISRIRIADGGKLQSPAPFCLSGGRSFLPSHFSACGENPNNQGLLYPAAVDLSVPKNKSHSFNIV